MFKIANRIRFNDGAHIETYIKKEKGRENSYDVINNVQTSFEEFTWDE